MFRVCLRTFQRPSNQICRRFLASGRNMGDSKKVCMIFANAVMLALFAQFNDDPVNSFLCANNARLSTF